MAIEREELVSDCGKYRVVFGMPEDEYHKHPAFSSSGARDILTSPLTFWAKSQMNPDREEEETDAKDYGKAYHKLILEGRAAFEAAYAPAIDAADYPKHLKSGDQLKERCGELGLPKHGKLSDMAARIRAVDKETPLYEEVIAAHEEKYPGRKFLTKKQWRTLELAWLALQASDAAPMLTGGYPEVSIFWVDAETGVECKARIDYLKPNHIMDPKSFSNSQARPVLDCVGASITNYKYPIQGRMYIDGLEQVLQHIADPRLGIKNGAVTFSFIFQESGAAPNIVPRDFVQYDESGKMNAYWVLAETRYRTALDIYAFCKKKYGTEPWVQPSERRALRDDDLPAYHFK